MALAPDAQRSACLWVMYLAILHARSLGWKGETEGLTTAESDQLARLMSAIHNMPLQIENWERCDESLLRAGLADADAHCGSNLLAEYDGIVRQKS